MCHKHKFGMYDSSDIFQEAILIGLEKLDSYDPTKPLENYLSVVIRNRLINLKRDNHYKSEPKDCTQEEYDEWARRNAHKKNLIEPLPMDSIKDEHEKSMWCKIDFINDFSAKEIFQLIDDKLPIELRADFLRLKQGAKIPKNRKDKVEQHIITILEEAGYEAW